MEKPGSKPGCVRLVAAALALALAAGTFAGCAQTASDGAPGSDSPSWSQGAGRDGSAEPSLAFRTAEKLQEHFRKHGRETGCSTPEEYLAAANAVVADPASLHKTQREDGDDLYFRNDTGEFVVVSPAGYLRTYFLTDRDYFDRQ